MINVLHLMPYKSHYHSKQLFITPFPVYSWWPVVWRSG